MVNNSLVGLELVQRAAHRQLFDNLNDGLVEIAAIMDPSDQEIAAYKGLPYVATALEPIAPENFYEGHIPSLINSHIDSYPNCAVIATRGAAASGSDELDQLTAYQQVLAVEIMTRSESDEEEVNRRCDRTAEAANLALMRDQTLGGVISGFDTAPSISKGDVFTKKERTSYGPHWFWQGARLEYVVRKEAIKPASTGSIFGSLNIDQA